MMRRIVLALFSVLVVAASAWPKFNPEDQKYLDEKFKALADQVQALTTQLQTVVLQLQDVRQKQEQFKAIIDNQQRSLKELDEMVRSMQIGSEENFSGLKQAITQLRNETTVGLKTLGGGVAPGPAPSEPARTGGTTAALQCNVVHVEGSTVGSSVTLDVGSSTPAIHQGSRLKLYKASDPSTQVGVIEITQIIDAGNSRAQIVTLDSGVQVVFGDVARLE
jgi:uncharacterized phage infection (PIP) family protein YhgE